MKTRIFLSLLFIIQTSCSFAQTSTSNAPGLYIQEEDGSPAARFRVLKVSNTTLTNNGDGSASLDTGGGGSGDVNWSDINWNEIDITEADWSGVDESVITGINWAEYLGGAEINWAALSQQSTVGINWNFLVNDIDTGTDYKINWQDLQQLALADGAINWNITTSLNFTGNDYDLIMPYIEGTQSKTVYYSGAVQDGTWIPLCSGSVTTDGHGVQISNSSGNLCLESFGAPIPEEDADIQLSGTVAADNNVTRFHGTTGTIQDSTCSISDAGVLTCAGFVSTGVGDTIIDGQSIDDLFFIDYSTDDIRFGGATNYILLTDGKAMTFAGSASFAPPAALGGRSLTVSSTAVDADAELYTDFKSVTIETPTDSDNFFVFEAPMALTVTRVHAIVEAATSAVITWQECDSAGDNCSTIESVTADVDGVISTSIDNASLDAGDVIRVDIGTVTGTVGQVNTTLTFTKND